MSGPVRLALLTLLTWSAAAASLAEAGQTDAAPTSAIEACRAIEGPPERLECYDRLPGEQRLGQATPVDAATTTEAGKPPAVAGAKESEPPPTEPTAMAIRWELDEGTDRGLWVPRGHRRTYLLPARWTTSVNDAPSSPTQAADADYGPIASVEFKFQLSLKLKAVDDLFGSNADLWVGYTQQSHWQLYNTRISRSFRETNYEPEVFATIPVTFPFFGLTGRMVNVGLLHQSNGQPDPGSRSWNRVYAQVGLERGAFSLLVRPWVRIDEAPADDNNPDITSYVGRGDIVGIWSKRGQTASLMLRSSFEDDWRGAAQLDYSFPIGRNLKGYAQVFSGYGESLIDYNHRQTTVSLGLLLVDLL
jgi:phospholipase A1